MKSGLYDHVITALLERQLGGLGERALKKPLDPADSHTFLAQILGRLLEQALRAQKKDAGTTEERGFGELDVGQCRLQSQIRLCNRIISLLQEGHPEREEWHLAQAAEKLLAVVDRPDERLPRPDTPLSLGCLLTGTNQDPTLVSQLQKEILSCDRVDILCSFIKWSGIRLLQEALKGFVAKPDAQLRIITTSYMGATDLKAVEFLESLPRTELKVSYDTHRTRLHAKAYLFHRETGFGSAYIGSANISSAAMTEGLEWNTKVSQYEQPFQWEKITATFESYWNEAEFETFRKSERERLRKALSDERPAGDDGLFVQFFDLRPYGFQQEILDRIQAERTLLGRKRHLIVAATGTGKTMIAAFDFRQWRNLWREAGNVGEPYFLFIAHREEILRQSLATFRAVLRDQNFGDLMVAGQEPSQKRQLFLSIQTLNSREFLNSIASTQYAYIVVDEFHHASAPSYRQLLQYVTPECLLGLTATPERHDGLDVTATFGGRITAEIRLPDAINRKLLCPFQYFGITDAVNYSGLRWERGCYVRSDLERVLSGNDVRSELIIRKVSEILLDPRKARGLGFCVSQAHAGFMADRFSRAGIPAAFLTAESPDEDRRTARRRLQNREINFLFVVDLFNEGVDIPEVDTVLFLRPTESLTVFLQQFGRGLRLSEGKECLTVLDFIGQAHQDYRFDLRFRALTMASGTRIDEQVRGGFAHLPSGCTIQLERQAREFVLENLQRAISRSKPRLLQHIRFFVRESGRELTLESFLEFHRLDPDEIFRRGTWSRLCVEANVRDDFSDPDEGRLTKGLRRLLHIDDPLYIDRMVRLLDVPTEAVETLDTLDCRYLLMLHFTLWGKESRLNSLSESLRRLRENPVLLRDLRDVLACRRNLVSLLSPRLDLPFICPLRLHSSYTREEILSGFDYWTLDRQPPVRQGVIFVPEIQADLFFVTLNKNEKDYSPTTMYEDYAISDRLFHWQSQSTTSDTSPTGQRYIHHRSRGSWILLFVREHGELATGLSAPFHFLGPAEYVSHQGSRPISFVWRLMHPIPAHLKRESARLLVG